MEKSFMDYWFINDKEGMKKYTEIHNIEDLNILECCLIAHSFIESDQEISTAFIDLIKMHT
jgi:hypothetical protein